MSSLHNTLVPASTLDLSTPAFARRFWRAPGEAIANRLQIGSGLGIQLGLGGRTVGTLIGHLIATRMGCVHWFQDDHLIWVIVSDCCS